MSRSVIAGRPVTEIMIAGKAVAHTAQPDRWTQRRYYVDEVEVVTIHAPEGRLWRCSPDHAHGRMGGCLWVPLGEHLAGCGWVASRSEWAVYLTRVHTSGPRYLHRLGDAYATAEDLIARYYA